MRLIPQPLSSELLGGFSSVKDITERITVDGMNEEEYELTVSAENITVKASYDKGFYYAAVTLKQMKLLYDRLPCVRINDRPRYPYRGFMIDCARHMFSLDELKKMISIAADLKFNKLHWHLSDDQGFRIELDNFPELTEKGSVRDCDNFRNLKNPSPYSGYYKKSEIREIIDFCAKKYIDVIPEFDMPGHQSAFLHTYPQFSCKGTAVEVKAKEGIFKDIVCAGNEEAKSTLKGILDEICELFYYDTVHIGGDEAPKNNWKSCEKCQRAMRENGIKNEQDLQCHFINEMAEYLANKGKKCIVWNDCLKGDGLSRDITVQYWMGNKGKTAKAVNSGAEVIMSSFMPMYVDYPYGMHPLKAVYSYEPEDFSGLTQEGKKNILGVESPIWTEYIDTDERLEYMCFPRWFAVAETAWSKKENKDYKKFCFVLDNLAEKYRREGLTVADKAEWDPAPVQRLKRTLGFFI